MSLIKVRGGSKGGRSLNYDAFSIKKSGLYFNAYFIKSKNYQEKKSVEIFFDPENPFIIYFEFFDKITDDGFALIRTGRDSVSNGRTTKAQTAFSGSNVLSSLINSPKNFEIKFSTHQNKFFAQLMPNFELRIPFTEKNKIDSEITGIYRYLDENKEIIYIGRGNIKNRSNEIERENWGIITIEYSVILNEDEEIKCENEHIIEFEEKYGRKPTFNKIKGFSKQTIT